MSQICQYRDGRSVPDFEKQLEKVFPGNWRAELVEENDLGENGHMRKYLYRIYGHLEIAEVISLSGDGQARNDYIRIYANVSKHINTDCATCERC